MLDYKWGWFQDMFPNCTDLSLGLQIGNEPKSSPFRIQPPGPGIVIGIIRILIMVRFSFTLSCDPHLIHHLNLTRVWRFPWKISTGVVINWKVNYYLIPNWMNTWKGFWFVPIFHSPSWDKLDDDIFRDKEVFQCPSCNWNVDDELNRNKFLKYFCCSNIWILF